MVFLKISLVCIHKNIHHPIIKNGYRTTLIIQTSPCLKQTVDTLKNSAITQQHLGGGGTVGWGRASHTVHMTDCTGLFTALVSYMKLT